MTYSNNNNTPPYLNPPSRALGKPPSASSFVQPVRNKRAYIVRGGRLKRATGNEVSVAIWLTDDEASQLSRLVGVQNIISGIERILSGDG